MTVEQFKQECKLLWPASWWSENGEGEFLEDDYNDVGVDINGEIISFHVGDPSFIQIPLSNDEQILYHLKHFNEVVEEYEERFSVFSMPIIYATDQESINEFFTKVRELEKSFNGSIKIVNLHSL